eukprot:582409-Alexandrium_andersonii.AAC.1
MSAPNHYTLGPRIFQTAVGYGVDCAPGRTATRVHYCSQQGQWAPHDEQQAQLDQQCGRHGC